MDTLVPVISDGNYIFTESGAEILCMNAEKDYLNIELTSQIRETLGISHNSADRTISKSNVPQNGCRIIWTVQETKNLLAAYKKNQPLFKGTTLKQDAVWEIVAEDLNQKFNWVQCKNKFVNLKKKYTKLKDTARNSGGPPIEFDYKEEFDEMFGTDHNLVPVAIACSSQPPQIEAEANNIEQYDILDENSSEIPRSSNKKKRKKTVQECLLDEIKKMREDKNDRFDKELAVKKLHVEAQNKIAQTLEESTNIFKNVMEKLIERIDY